MCVTILEVYRLCGHDVDQQVKGESYNIRSCTQATGKGKGKVCSQTSKEMVIKDEGYCLACDQIIQAADARWTSFVQMCKLQQQHYQVFEPVFKRAEEHRKDLRDATYVHSNGYLCDPKLNYREATECVITHISMAHNHTKRYATRLQPPIAMMSWEILQGLRAFYPELRGLDGKTYRTLIEDVGPKVFATFAGGDISEKWQAAMAYELFKQCSTVAKNRGIPWKKPESTHSKAVEWSTQGVLVDD
ncbi:hypothetical protein F5Y15DRAFT_420108 [Xylariaceae sp. FL0016]|nr:hypothetical protein F5Y15DRAFT_420108 [Xylariaceae sp. FL0016]